MTSPAPSDARYRAYWEAIQRHVCSVCLDQASDGTCGLTRRTCAIQRHLPRLAEVLSRVESPRMDEYEAAIRAEICSTCPEEDASGRCALRASTDCALYTYLPLVLEAVESVKAETTT
ncbi:MAG TPA: hypothetical protein VII13_02420 [Vicinamibacteria bacterium]